MRSRTSQGPSEYSRRHTGGAWWTIGGAGNLVQFPVDTEATYSVLTSHAGHLVPETCSIVGVEGRPKQKRLTTPLTCTWGKTLITHKSFVMPECPSPLLGRDFLSVLGATFALPENENKAYFWLNYVLYKTQTVQPIFSPVIGKLTDPQISDQRPRMGKICHSTKNHH